jgi:hypothetical protein
MQIFIRVGGYGLTILSLRGDEMIQQISFMGNLMAEKITFTVHTRTWFSIVLVVFVAFLCGPVWAASSDISVAQSSRINQERFVGVWIVSQKSSSIFSSGSTEKSFWDINLENNQVIISIPNKSIVFKNVNVSDNRLRAQLDVETTDGEETYIVDVVFSRDFFQGTFSGLGSDANIKGHLAKAHKILKQGYNKWHGIVADLKNKVKASNSDHSAARKMIADLNTALEKKVKESVSHRVAAKERIVAHTTTIDKMKAAHLIEVQALELKVKSLNKSLINKPPKISADELETNFSISSNTALRAGPNKGSRITKKVSIGDRVANLAEIPDIGWALVATEQGFLGYIPSELIVVKRGRGRRITREPDGINSRPAPSRSLGSITLLRPSWDKGYEGKRATIASAGYVSIRGSVRQSATIKSVTVNNKTAKVSPDGGFNRTLLVSGNQNVKLVVTRQNGKKERLAFDLIVRPR